MTLSHPPSFIIALAGLFLFPRAGSSAEFYFNLKQRACINQEGKQGHNKSYLGECGTPPQVNFSREARSHQNFRGADLKGAKFLRAKLDHIDFKGAHLENSQFIQTTCQSCDFSLAHASNSHFDGANLFDSLFILSKLEGTSFFGSILQGADLRKANLKNANLKNSKLEGANLQGCVLEGADLTGANLGETPLQENQKKEGLLVLNPTDLKGATFNSKTKLPFSKETALQKGMLFKDETQTK